MSITNLDRLGAARLTQRLGDLSNREIDDLGHDRVSVAESHATGRSSRIAGPSEIGRPETIEQTGELWEHDLASGLRIGIDTHAITSHFVLPLLIRRPGGLGGTGERLCEPGVIRSGRLRALGRP